MEWSASVDGGVSRGIIIGANEGSLVERDLRATGAWMINASVGILAREIYSLTYRSRHFDADSECNLHVARRMRHCRRNGNNRWVPPSPANFHTVYTDTDCTCREPRAVRSSCMFASNDAAVLLEWRVALINVTAHYSVISTRTATRRLVDEIRA